MSRRSKASPLSADEILKGLRTQGFRLTQSRMKIVHFILEQKGHWTIQDLAERARKRMPRISIATLYRTVALLHKQKLLTENLFGDSASRYEVAPLHHHDHLRCMDCGEIFEFENDRIEKLQDQVAKSMGFDLVDHRMELYGRCQIKNCRRKGP